MKISEHLRLAASDVDLILQHYKLAPLLAGEPTTLYHGTTKTFTKFDLAKSRTELVNQFYGIGLFFTPSKKVAWRYADANRNIGFEPELVDDLRKVNRSAGDFLALLVQKGEAAWDDLFAELKKKYPGKETWEAVPEYFGSVDPNTLNDISDYVLGSKTRPLGGGEAAIDIFHQSTGLPGHIYNSLDEVGIDSKKYRPKIYTVSVTARKVLVTKSKAQARSAKSKGYDAVVYYDGPDLINGIPEVAVFDASRVRITHVEVGD